MPFIMPRRRPKKKARIQYQSTGPLPLRFADRFAGHILVFSDASEKRHGGQAAVIFADADGEPQINSRTTPLIGSNEQELQAALFALHHAGAGFPDKPLALFCDNLDTVNRLQQAKMHGLGEDPELAQMLAEQQIIDGVLENTVITWIKAHATCRGNTLADHHAALAAA